MQMKEIKLNAETINNIVLTEHNAKVPLKHIKHTLTSLSRNNMNAKVSSLESQLTT